MQVISQENCYPLETAVNIRRMFFFMAVQFVNKELCFETEANFHE